MRVVTVYFSSACYIYDTALRTTCADTIPQGLIINCGVNLL